MSKKKILICGFPHCGTTILKCIIGHIPEVFEIIEEVYNFDTFLSFDVEDKNKNYILGKCPWYCKEITTLDRYKDFYIIFIIRNPVYVFSSLNERFRYNIPDNHSIDRYINICKSILIEKHKPNYHFIKYEDLFDNDYEKLKIVLDDIGLKYNSDIFNNTEYENKSFLKINKNNIKVSQINHVQYRTNQINKDFINNNDEKKINLNDSQMRNILNDETINIIYPDIKNKYCKYKK